MKGDDSDNDEGFVPTKVEVKADLKAEEKKQNVKKQRPIDFQGRYIYGDGLMRKQPSQIYTRFTTYLPEQQKKQQIFEKSIMKQISGHPYQKYIESEAYTLVYSRFKDRMSLKPQDDNFGCHEINLSKTLNSYEPDHYSILKAFDFNPSADQTKDLQFDSRFECGNLLHAFKDKKSDNSYALFLQNDTNSNGYNQWFYFSLKYAKAGIPYRFSIVNLKKKHSFFKEGMKISTFSLIDAQNNGGVGWTKNGANIKYERSPIRKFADPKFKFYCLSFQVTFQHQNDFVCLAMNIPYSYSRLIQNVKNCFQISEENKRTNWEMVPIAHTLANNAVPCLTITSKDQDENKKLIVILARQHPGETWSSFLMEEFLYQLAESKSESVLFLLKHYVFKIFPMVNVDGVIYGNFRCDLGGFDLNRKWKCPDRSLLPQVFAIRAQVQRLSSEHVIECVLDLHGHSKQYNTFCYSCKNDAITCRILPLLISELTPIFTFPSCTFGISKYKETTARAVIYKIISNENVLTIQNSFFGYKFQDQLIPYSPCIINTLAVSILEGMKIFLEDEEVVKRARAKITENLATYMDYEKKANVESGSESDPDGDQISISEKIRKILPKSFVSIEKQLAEEEKEEKAKGAKVRRPSIKKKSNHKNYQTLVPKTKYRAKNKIEEQEQPKTFAERTSFTQYKKGSRELFSFKKSDHTIVPTISLEGEKPNYEKLSFQSAMMMTKQSDTKLPFYLRDKPALVPIKLKNDSFEVFKDAYNATKSELTNKQFQAKRSTLKGNVKKMKIDSSMHHTTEQFPMLCVLSQSKKKSQMEKVRDVFLSKDGNNQGRLQKEVIALPQKPSSFVQNEKILAMKRGKKQKDSKDSRNNVELVSKYWRENFNRYGKDLNVFFGGTNS